MSTPTIPVPNTGEREGVLRKGKQRSAEQTYAENIAAGATATARPSVWRRIVNSVRGWIGRHQNAISNTAAAAVIAVIETAVYVGAHFGVAFLAAHFGLFVGTTLFSIPVVNLIVFGVFLLVTLGLITFAVTRAENHEKRRAAALVDAAIAAA